MREYCCADCEVGLGLLTDAQAAQVVAEGHTLVEVEMANVADVETCPNGQVVPEGCDAGDPCDACREAGEVDAAIIGVQDALELRTRKRVQDRVSRAYGKAQAQRAVLKLEIMAAQRLLERTLARLDDDPAWVPNSESVPRSLAYSVDTLRRLHEEAATLADLL